MTRQASNEVGRITFIGTRTDEGDPSQDSITVETILYGREHGGATIVLHFSLGQFLDQTGIVLPDNVFTSPVDEGWSFDDE